MISRHVDILAVMALLFGILICSEIRQSVWARMLQGRTRLRVEQISVRVPEPPVVPIVFQ
jgi:hypothetical protein